MKRLLAVLILCAGVTSAGAQTYPAKPVKIIVPTAPGGGYDFIARLLSEKLSADLGQGFIVENRTGAGLVVGSQAAATAPPDPYVQSSGGATITPDLPTPGSQALERLYADGAAWLKK
jgi:tripartite-type tricarboxylate transporter receptor subunit TctC